MNFTDEEVELITKWNVIRKRFVDAKGHRHEKPDEYAAAKAEMSQMRSYWRSIRDYVGVHDMGASQSVGAGSATAKPEAVKSSAAVKES